MNNKDIGKSVKLEENHRESGIHVRPQSFADKIKYSQNNNNSNFIKNNNNYRINKSSVDAKEMPRNYNSQFNYGMKKDFPNIGYSNAHKSNKINDLTGQTKLLKSRSSL